MGDNRRYLYRNGKVEQLIEDHSIVGILVRDGEITAEDAKTHPARGTVSRFIGMEGVVYPDVKSIKISKGDRLPLQCWLTGMVSDEVIPSKNFALFQKSNYFSIRKAEQTEPVHRSE